MANFPCALQYYYSIKDISIGGRCVCHGHADVCDAKDPNDPYRYLLQNPCVKASELLL